MGADTWERLRNLVWNMTLNNIESKRCLRFSEVYGEWGVLFSFYMNPYLVFVPLLVTLVISVGIVRGKHFGRTQLFLIAIMLVDMCFIMVSSVRDGLLVAFKMDYGFIEYRVCELIILSFRIQMMMHGTAIWLKTLMTVNQVLIVGFPFKVKTFNFKRFMVVCIVIHFTIVVLYQLWLQGPEFTKINIVQEFKAGVPMKVISGCSLKPNLLFKYEVNPTLSSIIYLSFVCYFNILPFAINFIAVLMLVFLLRKNLNKMSNLSANKSIHTTKVKFIILIKVNIFLGISYIFQEAPVVVIPFFRHLHWLRPFTNYIYYQGMFIVSIAISFSIGKPIDLIIYASLCSVFKSQIKDIFQYVFGLCKARDK